MRAGIQLSWCFVSSQQGLNVNDSQFCFGLIKTFQGSLLAHTLQDCETMGTQPNFASIYYREYLLEKEPLRTRNFTSQKGYFSDCVDQVPFFLCVLCSRGRSKFIIWGERTTLYHSKQTRREGFPHSNALHTFASRTFLLCSTCLYAEQEKSNVLLPYTSML